MIRRETAIVLGVFVVLLALVLYLQYKPDAEQEASEEDLALLFEANTTVQANEKIFDFAADKVIGLKLVEKGGRSLVVGQDEGGAFALVKPAVPPEQTNAVIIFETIDMLSQMTVAVKLDTMPPLEAMGLDKPSYALTIYLPNDNEVTLLVGDLTPTQTGYYVTLYEKSPVVVERFVIDTLVSWLDEPPVVLTPTPEPTPEATPETTN